MKSSQLVLSNYPGAALALESLHPALLAQQSRIEGQSSRGFQIVGMATAIVGIGLPFSFGLIPAQDPCAWLYALLAGIPVIVYAWAVKTALPVLKKNTIRNVDRPDWLRETIWSLSTDKAKVEILAHGERAHKQNEEEIAERLSLLQRLLGGTIATALLVALHAAGMVVLKFGG